MPKFRALDRLRSVVKSVAELDPDHPDFPVALDSIKKRAELALKEVKLGRGNPTGLLLARKKAVESRRQASREFRAMMMPVITQLRGEGITTYRALAEALNERGIKPPRAEKWTAGSVRAIEQPDNA